eukprot:COSAG01_NODE_2820_length_7012_cov_5.502965_5_plen_103_part_00
MADLLYPLVLGRNGSMDRARGNLLLLCRTTSGDNSGSGDSSRSERRAQSGAHSRCALPLRGSLSTISVVRSEIELLRILTAVGLRSQLMIKLFIHKEGHNSQ